MSKQASEEGPTDQTANRYDRRSFSVVCHELHERSAQGGGGNSLRPYSQQRPMKTNLSCCPSLIDNGHHKSTHILLVLEPHENPHDIMRILENLCMLPDCHKGEGAAEAADNAPGQGSPACPELDKWFFCIRMISDFKKWVA